MTWVAFGVGGATLVGGIYGANKSADAQSDSLRQAGKQNKKAMALQQPWLDRSNQAADQLQMLMGLGNNDTVESMYAKLLPNYIRQRKIDTDSGFLGSSIGKMSPSTQLMGKINKQNGIADKLMPDDMERTYYGDMSKSNQYGGILHGKGSEEFFANNPELAKAISGLKSSSGSQYVLKQEDYDRLKADVDAQLAKQKAAKEGGSFGSLAKRFTLDDFIKEPGYDFRLNEGNQALDRSASARGNLFSGAQAKALTDYNQDFASNEYGNAYNRFTADQGNLYNRLSGIVGGGQQALQNQTGLYGNAANYAIGAGNVNAANTQAQMGALTSGIGAMGSAWQNQSGIQSTKNPNAAYKNPWAVNTRGRGSDYANYA
jgi:hypothetical protein